MFNLNQTSVNFILATGRTGSTLLSSILNVHPNILVANEEPFAYILSKKYQQQTHWDQATITAFINDFYVFYEKRFVDQFGKREDLEELFKQQGNLTTDIAIKLIYLNFFPQKDKTDVKILMDKQLKHHLILNDLQKQFPDAKYVVLVRDPRDNIAIKLRRAKKLNTKQDIYSASVNWNYAYNSILKKTKQLPASRIYFLKYEDLVVNTEATLKHLCRFLDVPFTDRMLYFHEAINEGYNNLSDEGKELFDALHNSLKSQINSKKVGLWENELTAEEIETIMSICGKTYKEIGYDITSVPQTNKWNKSYIRAAFYLHKKNAVNTVYNQLISKSFFSFLKKYKRIKNVPG